MIHTVHCLAAARHLLHRCLPRFVMIVVGTCACAAFCADDTKSASFGGVSGYDLLFAEHDRHAEMLATPVDRKDLLRTASNHSLPESERVDALIHLGIITRAQDIPIQELLRIAQTSEGVDSVVLWSRMVAGKSLTTTPPNRDILLTYMKAIRDRPNSVEARAAMIAFAASGAAIESFQRESSACLRDPKTSEETAELVCQELVTVHAPGSSEGPGCPWKWAVTALVT